VTIIQEGIVFFYAKGTISFSQQSQPSNGA